MKCVFFSNLNILIPQKHGGRRERGKKWDWETNNSINKSFSSNVVPGRFLMDEIKHFHLHLPPDRARINPSSWSAELRHQTDTARAETAADTSLSLSPRFNSSSNNNNSFSGNVLAFKAAHFWSASIWVWAHSDTRAQGGGSAAAAAVAVARALSSAEVAFRLCGTARTLLKQRSFRVFPPAQVFDFQPCRTNSSIVRWIKRG